MNTKSNTEKSSTFTVTSIYDVEIIASLQFKFKSSLATVYRSIKKANLPLYCLPPNKRSQTFVLAADLWRLSWLPVWRKFLKRNHYQFRGKWELWHIRKDYADSDLISLYEQGWFKPLTLQELMSAVDMGVIPTDNNLNLPVWFIASVKGLLDLGLPRKI